MLVRLPTVTLCYTANPTLHRGKLYVARNVSVLGFFSVALGSMVNGRWRRELGPAKKTATPPSGPEQSGAKRQCLGIPGPRTDNADGAARPT